MSGHVRQRGSSWELRAFAGRDPLTGRKRYETRTVKASGKREAEKALAGFVREVDRGLGVTGTTFGELLEKWLEVRSPAWSPQTTLNTRGIVDGRLEGLKGLEVRRMTTADLDVFYSALRARGGRNGTPLAPGTVQRTHTVIRSALKQAVAWGWRDDNPAVHASPGPSSSSEISPPSGEEVRILADAAREDPELLLYIALDAETGARRAELAALRWSDVGEAAVTIRRALVIGEDTPENRRRYEGRIWPAGVTRGRPSALIEKEKPKTKSSVRTIALSASMAALLLEHRTRCTARALAAGVALPREAFVFAAEVDGSRPWRPETWSHRFRRLRERVGLESVRLHDLRHYVATTLLAAGVDLTTVAGRLGHGGGGKTTLAIYSHFRQGSAPDRAAAELLSGLLTAPAPTLEPEEGDAEVIPLRPA